MMMERCGKGLPMFSLATIRRFIRDEKGATAIEYGMIAVILGIGLVAAFTGLKNNLNASYNNVATTVGNS
jgi:pilus assembly protein Flp/PilA